MPFAPSTIRCATLVVAFVGLIGTAAAAAPPEGHVKYHQLQRGPDKAASELKPITKAPDIEPIMVELRAHYHADGSISYSCDEDHGEQARPRSAQDSKENER